MPILKTAAVAFPIPDLGFLIEGTEGNDTLSDLISGVDWSSNDTVNGLGGNDWITLYNGNDTANGGAGNDVFYDRGNGNDVMNGEAGADLSMSALATIPSTAAPVPTSSPMRTASRSSGSISKAGLQSPKASTP